MFRILLLESQLEASKGQNVHLEAKLAVTGDYEQLKTRLVSLEAERNNLLVSITNMYSALNSFS